MNLLEHSRELLAPAGSLEVFNAAIDNGCDAVYVGAPVLNARALARDFQFHELAAMVDAAHEKGRKVYLAMNSLMKNEEIPLAIRTLAFAEKFAIDGLIVQDLGIVRLARMLFPGLRLHASTLMTIHNAGYLQYYEQLGFQRIVLAREMALAEIAEAVRSTRAEIEVFVHGALCYAYSGLCLFSSFHGGKSGLRGQCVQPCRRKYQIVGKKGFAKAGYQFSMSDLEALRLLVPLAEAGVHSFKIEGRMRSAQYVGNVVRAYRTILDHLPTPDEATWKTAEEFLRQSMGRKTTSGFYSLPLPDDLIVQQHSGNIGQFIGRVEKIQKGKAFIQLKGAIRRGDRLRIHDEQSGERNAFRLNAFFVNGNETDSAEEDEVVAVAVGEIPFHKGDSLYRVDVAARARAANASQQVHPEHYGAKTRKFFAALDEKRLLGRLRINLQPDAGQTKKMRKEHRHVSGAVHRKARNKTDLFCKVDSLSLLKTVEQYPFDGIIFSLSKANFGSLLRYRPPKPFRNRFVVSLPPVITQNVYNDYEKFVALLLNRGFNLWQLGHLGQLSLFVPKWNADGGAGAGKRRKNKHKHATARPSFYADYTLNIMNSLAAEALAAKGMQSMQASIEANRSMLGQLGSNKQGYRLGMTVYGAVPLCYSRATLTSMPVNKTVRSPRDEDFVVEQAGDIHTVKSTRPLNLIQEIPEMAKMGLDYFIIDFSSAPLNKNLLAELFEKNPRKPVRKGRFSTFNYYGELV